MTNARREHDDTEILTVPEAAALLRISRSRVYALAQALEIPSLRYGARTLRFRRQALMDHAEAIERGGNGNGKK